MLATAPVTVAARADFVVEGAVDLVLLGAEDGGEEVGHLEIVSFLAGCASRLCPFTGRRLIALFLLKSVMRDGRLCVAIEMRRREKWRIGDSISAAARFRENSGELSLMFGNLPHRGLISNDWIALGGTSTRLVSCG